MFRLNNIAINDILFIDIETVPLAPAFNLLDEGLQEVLSKSFQKEIDRSTELNLSLEEVFAKHGGIKSEYSKVICIGLAGLRWDKETHTLKLYKRTIGCDKDNESEKEILESFIQYINAKYTDKNLVLCGHNIQEFDIPFLCRRMLVNGLHIPHKINFQGKKPWDVSILDTMKLWSFGDYKNYTSLDLLCRIFHIPTPKETLSGDKVKKAYYEDKAYEAIKTYCIADVVATVQLLLKLNLEDLLSDAQMESIIT